MPDLVGSNPSMGLPPSVAGVRSLRSSSVGVWSGRMNVYRRTIFESGLDTCQVMLVPS